MYIYVCISRLLSRFLRIRRELITIPLIMIFLNPYVSYPALTIQLRIINENYKSVKGGGNFFSFEHSNGAVRSKMDLRIFERVSERMFGGLF